VLGGWVSGGACGSAVTWRDAAIVAIISAGAAAHRAEIRRDRVGRQLACRVRGAPASGAGPDLYTSDQAGSTSMPAPDTPGPQGHDHREGEPGAQASEPHHAWTFLRLLFFLPVRDV
jgi:hypothetical protein